MSSANLIKSSSAVSELIIAKLLRSCLNNAFLLEKYSEKYLLALLLPVAIILSTFTLCMLSTYTIFSWNCG